MNEIVFVFILALCLEVRYYLGVHIYRELSCPLFSCETAVAINTQATTAKITFLKVSDSDISGILFRSSKLPLLSSRNNRTCVSCPLFAVHRRIKKQFICGSYMKLIKPYILQDTRITCRVNADYVLCYV